MTITKLIELFSAKMLKKLNAKKRQGFSGWQHIELKQKLENDLLLHLKRALQGDSSQWVDVANYAAFLDYQTNSEK